MKPTNPPCRYWSIPLAALALLLTWSTAPAAPPGNPPVFVRVTLHKPAGGLWRVHVIAQLPGAKFKGHFAGQTSGDAAQGVEYVPVGQPSTWVDLTDSLSAEGATVRFLFEAPPASGKGPAQPLAGVEAKIDVASAADEASILRSVTDHDPGNVIALRLPADPAKDRDRILTIRQDTQRRLDQIKSWNLPDGPRPRKLWCLAGFRATGEFYTDSSITGMDLEILRRLGMNGWWNQNGGQAGGLRRLAAAEGLDRSTVYWRSVESPPRDPLLNGATRLKWDALDAFMDDVYRRDIARTRQAHPPGPGGMPEIIADLMDEPAGQTFDGPEYAEEFRQYLAGRGLTPRQFGKDEWGQVSPIAMQWRQFFVRRGQLDLKDQNQRRLFYWSAKFWNYSTARLYALATRKVEQYAPGVGTRVNFGPPWWYDYGTLPRGIDAFEFGRLRGVSLGFNEDWVGAGNPRVPLEINTLLMDWSRAAARPAVPPLGCYITRDADRATVKLRTFACLSRGAKIFDFYFYGPAYTFFDHWADNEPMVHGVAELTRDLGAADDVLAEGRPPAARVAMLYSQSWPVWKEDDTEQNEQVMAYLALLHAGIPVDIVSDEEVADGRFAARGYKCLYVVNESIPAAALAEIERWVRGGGRLWAAGWAGMRDEYNTPTPAWDAMLGAKSRSWKPTGDLKRLGQPIEPADWTRPIFGREVTIVPAEGAGPATWPASRPSGEASGAAYPAYRREYGAGVVRVVPWAAGKTYLDGAVSKPATLAKATIFPDDARRAVYADFAREAGVESQAVTSVSQVLAWPLWGQRRGAIMLANYTGEPQEAVRVRFESPLPITSARAVHAGVLSVTHPDPGHVEVTLPLRDVTEIIQVE